jgi:hypothetical protein
MPFGFRQPIYPMGPNDGPAVTTPASLTDATPLPANEIPGQFLQVGGMIYISVIGRFTSTATPGTLTFGIYMAKTGVAIGSATLIVASSAIVPLASQTNKTWHGHWELQVISLGAGGAGVGQVRGSGRIMGVVAAGSVDFAPATAPMAAVNVDTTAAQRLLLGLTPSVTTGSVTVHSMSCEYSGN